MADICAHLSKDAYDTIPHAKFISCDETGAQAFCWANNTTQYIVFRGTSGIRDLLTDIDIRRTSFHGTLVHRGFYTQYVSIAQLVKSNISDGVDTIICTGHSLGGALATLAAIDLADTGRRLMCCTFGSPRVGDAAMATLFERRVHTSCRVFHECDPIPMVPVTTRFTHVYGGYRIGKDTLIRPVERDDGFFSRLASIFRHNDIDYHSIQLYTLYTENLNLYTYQYGVRR